VLAADNRGAGESEEPANADYSLEAMARDTIALFTALGLRAVDAVGHSAGGTQLALVAAQRPDLIRRLVLLDPVLAFLDGGEPSPGNSAMAEGARRRRPEFESREAMRASYSSRPPFSLWQPPYLDAYLTWGTETLPDGRARLRCRPETEARMFEGVPRPGAAADLFARVHCPILLLTPGLEVGRVGPVEHVTDHAPRVRHRVVAGHGHFFPYETPDQTIAAIREFLAE
jgi:pimeloyl-ACP methyl ester carboxylesterase